MNFTTKIFIALIAAVVLGIAAAGGEK